MDGRRYEEGGERSGGGESKERMGSEGESKKRMGSGGEEVWFGSYSLKRTVNRRGMLLYFI